MLQWFYDLWPYTIKPSSGFCDIKVGNLFKDGPHTYRLLSHDACKVQVVHWNWWTRLWWGGHI